MKTRNLMFVVIAMMCSMVAKADDSKFYYTNPVMQKSMPDPTVLKMANGYYYVYATEDTHNIPIYRSNNLVDWTFVHTAFTNATRPTFVDGGGLWAPDINEINGQYVLYYAMSKWGGVDECGIGAAYSNKPFNYFTDNGPLFISKDIGVTNSIDEFYIEAENGNKYLFWGSFYGIYYIQLSDDGLSVKEGCTPKKVAGTYTEATYIYKHDGYYYMIGSNGSCCDGANSTYRLVVARSVNLLGPYVNKDGVSALNNGFSEMLKGDSLVAGPGHCSEIVEDGVGQTWILHHGYMRNAPDNGRCLYLEQVFWDSDGWPYIQGEHPADKWYRPDFGKTTFTYSDVDYIDFKGGDEQYQYFFDTGYIPNKNTRVELECYSYSQNEAGVPSQGAWRAIFSGRNTYQDGMSLFTNEAGDQWGYFVGGYVNNGEGSHEYDKKYKIVTRNGSLKVDDQVYTAVHTGFNTTTQRITIFSGKEHQPYFGRIYSFKIYEGSRLIHDYHPCLRNEDKLTVFHDEVTDEYIKPSVPGAFSYGSIVDDVRDIKEDVARTPISKYTYNLSGQRVGNHYKGIVIRNGHKEVME